MNKQIRPFLSLVLLSIVISANATNHEADNYYLSAIESDFNSYHQSNYDRIAQVDQSNFVVLKEDIERVQQALNKLGYNAGTVDGLAHNKTVSAIVELQRKEGLPITGEIDQRLLTFLGIR